MVNPVKTTSAAPTLLFLLALMAPALLGSHRIQVQNHTECQKREKKAKRSNGLREFVSG